jgi:hypothetical protein
MPFSQFDCKDTAFLANEQVLTNKYIKPKDKSRGLLPKSNRQDSKKARNTIFFHHFPPQNIITYIHN